MVKFYLRDKNSNGATSIFMTVFYEGKRLKMSTGLSIHPNYWNDKKMRAKTLLEFQQSVDLNKRLDELDTVTKSLFRKYQEENYYPSPQKIKIALLYQNNIPVKMKGAKTFWDHFDDYLEHKKKITLDVRDFKHSLKKHLKKVEEIIGKKLSFAIIANPKSNFAEEWTNYLSYTALNSLGEPGLFPNTIGKQNKNLKAFLNWCFDQNICSKFSLNAFPMISQDVDKVFLTEEELVLLDKVKLKDPEQIKVRDLFLIGCETGLRFSDFTRIHKDDFRNNFFYKTPKKTKKLGVKEIIFPISKRFDSIIKKYNYHIPHFDKNNVTGFNKIIREVCEQAGIDNLVINKREVAGKENTVKSKKFEEVSSHTCRRTFCTLKFLKGMDITDIMKFSGHTTERNFRKYLKLDALTTATRAAGYF